MAPPGDTDTESLAQRIADSSRSAASRRTPLVGEVLGIAARNIRSPALAPQANPGMGRLEVLIARGPGDEFEILGGHRACRSPPNQTRGAVLGLVRD